MDQGVAIQGSLAETLQGLGSGHTGPFWIHWEVEAVPALGDACCFDGSYRRAACSLESRSQSWGNSSDEGPGGPLRVLVRWADGGIERVRGVSVSCGLDPGGLPLVRVAGVDTAESVALLEALAARRSPGRRFDPSQAVAVLAYHADRSAGDALGRLASAGAPGDLREEAIFWIGQTRGEEGARFLAEVTRTDPSPEIREQAVFSLSQSEAPSAVPTIVGVARRDRDPEVRKQALFWLAQTGAEGAEEVLLARLEGDPDRDVREGAVFAISQLPNDRAVSLLIRIARERRDIGVRKRALFRLGQSADPRAIDFFAEVLER